MAKAMDNLRKQTKATSKQNRTKRREKKMKEYGRTSYNSSDKAYIDGNYKKVASNVAYGYNQGIKKGEITRGSDNDWLRDDAIRKNTQIKYNKSWDGYSKLTGELPKYSVLSSSKKDAKNVLEHANTFRLDGLKTAKQRAKSRNGIGKALEYGSGFLKDTIVDPVVDLMRGADLVGSAMTGAGLGVLENAENVMKGYKTDKNLVINNIKDSVKSSNKTGWGKGSSDFLDEKDERMFAKDKEFYTKTGNTHALEQLEKSKKNAEKNNKWAGLVWDFIGDPTNLAVGTAKNTSKAIAKSGKELLTGTADISTAIKSKHLDDIFFSSKPYEDLKIFDDSGANKIHNQLDNGYNRAVSNDAKKVIKQKVATSSQKPILASFLDELDNSSPYDGKQLRIDGRTLNKKYTQTKDAYVPQIMRNTDEVGDVIERTTRNNHSYQPNLFDTTEEGLGKHLSATKTNYDGMPTYNNHNNSMFATENFNSDYVRKPDPELKTGRYKYENGVKGNIKYDNELYDKVKEYERILDNSDDKTTDLIYDYLQEQEPEVYARLMDGSDLVDEIVDAGRKKELINDNYTS